MPYDPSKDYNPLTAGLVGAGAGFSGALDQGERIYQTGKKMLADRWGFPEASASAQAALDANAARRIEEARLYKPMQQAFPYETAIAEAAPALMYGPAGYSAAGTQAALNVSRRYLDELAAEYAKHGANTDSIARLVNALRNF
jgi:hypothetical protein